MSIRKQPLFVDLFAGCGGLSLGLLEAGWLGLFAVEREPRAFQTLTHNLMGRRKHRLVWPAWLPKQACSLEQLLSSRGTELARLEGRIDLLSGGPPCQGFSSIGKRRLDDPRNQLFRHYLEFVRIIQPKLVLIENVLGILHPFKTKAEDLHSLGTARTYDELIMSELRSLDYEVWPQLLFAVDYGVPQIRPRFFIIAARRRALRPAPPDPFDILRRLRRDFLIQKRLQPDRPVGAAQAIADLHTKGRLEPSPDNHRFSQGRYGPQRSAYQKLMHGDLNGTLADSHRLANHRPETVRKFRWFLDHSVPGRKLQPHERGAYVTKKHTINILHAGRPAPTVTTLPDDLLHYYEPRILTVRETARLQSFPDWFEFQGKYTTGGKERVKQCPRYTQVGNAVPPLLAEALGRALLEFKKQALK